MKCKICGKEFELSVTKHYISRGEEVQRYGIASIVGNNTEKEVKLYDTFDCPSCGCQIIAQERKRRWLDKPLDSIEENDYNDSVDIEDYACLGNYDEHLEECNQCLSLDKCVARSEANEICND